MWEPGSCRVPGASSRGGGSGVDHRHYDSMERPGHQVLQSHLLGQTVAVAAAAGGKL